MQTLRYYDVQGKKLPSVTTVIGTLPKPGLAAWKESMGAVRANQLSRERAIIGSMVHARILQRFSVKRLEMPKVYLPWMDLSEWLEEINYRVEIAETQFDELGLEISDCYCEKTMAEPDKGFAGTIDLIGSVNGVDTVADIKTSKTVYNAHYMQLGAYYLMAKFNDYNVDYGCVIKLHPFNDVEPELQWIDKDELSKWSEMFLEQLTIFNERVSNGLCPKCGVKPIHCRDQGDDYVDEYYACPHCRTRLSQ